MTADTDSATQCLVRQPSQISPAGTGESSRIDRSPGLSPSLTLLFSITCALAVANVYFAQPLLDSMAQSLGVASSMIGVVVTATQVGYALGLLFIVPLGDLVNRKRLILTQVLLSAVALAAVGAAQQWLALLGAMIVMGLLAVVVQVLVAYAAVLATPSQRGHAVGTVTSGIVLGILLARFTSGLIADIAGWRAVYFVVLRTDADHRGGAVESGACHGVAKASRLLPRAHPFALQTVHHRTHVTRQGPAGAY